MIAATTGRFHSRFHFVHDESEFHLCVEGKMIVHLILKKKKQLGIYANALGLGTKFYDI